MVIFRKIIGTVLLKTIFNGYSGCERCNMPCNIVKMHCTYYKKVKFDAESLKSDKIKFQGDNIIRLSEYYIGCNALCEHCFNKLTKEQRVPFYKKLYDSWTYKEETKFEEIEKAVLEEK